MPCAGAIATAAPVKAPPPAITLTDAALAHLKRLRDDSGSDKLLLRMGVKSGGCSGAQWRWGHYTVGAVAGLS